MECAVCGKKYFSEVWISAYGYLRKTDEAVSAQIGEAKVSAREPGIEWQYPPPKVSTFACNHCGYVMTFVELDQEIRDRIHDMMKSQT